MTHYTSVRLCRGGHSTAPRLFLETFRRRLGALSLPVALVALLPLVLLPPHAMALPQGGQVVAGQVTSAFSGPQLSLDQASRVAIMNWRSFNIAPDEFVRIFQSGPDAAMLARVTGGNPTELLGRLQADGKLFLINPKGILVGSGAVIDTAAFMASTLDVADADFLKGGPLAFRGDSAAGVVNLGRITAREGNVLLLAHTVRNDGEISAPRGTAGLGAGTEIYLASPDSPAFVIRANLPATEQKTGVENSGVITAAQAHLEAAGGSIYDLAINHSGRVQATGVERRPDGRVLLTADGGNVLVTGTAVARKADGRGGEILVGGDYQGKNPAVANAARTYVGPTATLEAGSASIGNSSAPGGRVIVWADGNTRFAGRIETGAEGFVEVSGRHGLDFAGSVNTRGGSLLLDPDDITIVSGSTSVPSGLGDASWTEIEDPGSQTLGTDTLASLLVDGSVSLWAANALTVDAPITAAAGGATGATLTLRASTLTVNKDISLANVANGGLRLVQHGGSSDSLTTAAGAALTAGQVTIDGFPITVLNGAVNTSELTYNAPDAASTSLTATNPGNSIAKLVVNTDVADPQALSFSGNVAVHSGTAMQVSAMIGAANNVTLSSAGNLTLLGADVPNSIPATQLTASGVTKLASTGGVLINQAGTGLLAGAARRLLYTSTTTGAFSLGGLTGYTRFSGVTFPNDPQTGATQALYRADGLLTITADAKSKTYGAADPTFTATYSGGTVSDLSTLPTFSIQQGAHVNAGTYTIVPAGAVSAGYYDLAYATGTLTINPATLTYVAHSATRTTVGADPAFSGAVTGFVNGDTLATATTGTLSFTTTATGSSPAGAYPLTGSGLTANHGNYIFAQAPGNATAFAITQAGLLVVTADSFIKTFGQPDPTFTATYTGGTVSDLTTLPSFSILEGAHTNVGTYTIVPSGAASATHTLSYQNGTLTINPATLTYVANATSRATGAANPAFSGTVTGFVGGDTLASATTGTLVFTSTATPASPAGSYALTGSGLTANHGNYIFQQAAGNATAFTITAGALLTVTANDFIKTFGQPDPTFTASYSGGTAADLTTLPTFSILQGTHVNVGTYTIVPSGAASSTHTLQYVNGTLRIDPATLTYVANAASRIYGDANPAFSGTVTGFVNGDTLASATTGTLTFTSPATAASNAGTHAINGGGLTANNGNYVFQDAVANFTALTVNKAPLTVTFANATRTYGAANPAFTGTFSGFRNGDTAAVLSDFALVTDATTASPVGTYPITGTPTAGNYAVTVVPGTLTITPAPLTLTGTSVSSVYGDPIPAADYTVSGLLGGDTASVLSGVSFGTVFFGSPLPGTYDLTFASTGTAQNYAVTKVVPGTLTVTRRPLTVTAANVQSIAGAIPPFTSSIAGGPVPGGPGFTIKFAAYQNTAAAGGAAQLTPVDLAHNPAPGTYVIRPVVVPAGGATADELRNAYDFTLTDGVLTLDRPAVPVDYLINATSVILPNTAAGDATLLYTGPQDSDAVLSQDNLKKIDYTASDPVRVKAGSMPISPTQLGQLTRELAGDFAPYLDEMIEGPALTNAQKEIIGQLKSGAISIERFSGLVESDPEVRGAVMTLMAQVMLNKMESGQPLTATQQEFAARMTRYVEMRRQMIKEELIRLRNESIMEQAADGTNNQYAIKTMPDIARTAEQLATERLAWAAIGAGGGTAMGAGVAAFLNVPAVAGKLLPYAGSKVTEHVIKETGEVIVRSAVQPAKSIGAAGSAVAVAVVVTLVVITVEAGVMVVQEQQNKDAFNAAMDRASTSVAPNLSNLDLKNDEKARSEFTAAFLSVMMETGFR